MSVNLIFPVFNRLEYTKQSWHALQANTNWSLVTEFHVYDDGSSDGTRDWLVHQSTWLQPTFHATSFRSPMGVTLHWIREALAKPEPVDFLAKLDNDTIYPPDWLDIALEVMEKHPELDTLGLECMRRPVQRLAYPPHVELPSLYCREDGSPAVFGYLDARFISGLGLYRTRIFKDSLPEDRGYFGLEEWQEANKVKAGWILPSLPTILLDRLPIQPWAGLSEQYVRAGWQRKWSLDLRYKPEQAKIWEWWEPQL